MNTLQEIYLKHKVGDWPDKNSTHSYIPIYEEILAPYRTTAKNILEIGLMSGESLRMWDEYFSGDVYGIDCSLKPVDGKADLTQAIADGLKISIGDATSKGDIDKFYKGMKFDVIIEDANHDRQQQIDIYFALKSYINDGGIYIIEDIQDIDPFRRQFATIFNYMSHRTNLEIIDRRRVKGRYDDVIAIIRK